MRVTRACSVGMVALGLFVGGCMAPASSQGDAALAEVQRLRVEAVQRDGVIAVLREKQEAMSQQIAVVTAMATATRDPRTDAEVAQRLAEISERLGRIDVAFARWKKEEEPSDVDLAAARRTAEQGTDEERAAAVRKVQAMLDAGQVKVTVKTGKVQLSLLRPLDAKDPYNGSKVDATPAAAARPAPRTTAPGDLLLDRR